MPLYRHPRQRQRWGDTQVHPVKEWGAFHISKHVGVLV
jgi:hypothetical protein